MRHLTRILPVLLALALAACAPDFRSSPTAFHALPESVRSPAHLGDTYMVADDGVVLAAREWLPQNDPKAIIIALHGIDDYSNAFALSAPIWAAHGIATFAYDQRGFGANPHAGRWPGTPALCRDLLTAVRLAHARWPDVAVYALGESMGGAVVLTAAGGGCPTPMRGAERPDGIILAAPAVWARSTMPWPDRTALWLAARLIPDTSFTGSGEHIQASDNIPMLIGLGHDPLFIKATRTDAIYGLSNIMDSAYAAHPGPSMPALLLYGKHDELVPKRPMRSVARNLLRTDPGAARVAYYAHGWHMLLRDLEYRKVAEDVAAWMANHDAALPSGADRAGAGFVR